MKSLMFIVCLTTSLFVHAKEVDKTLVSLGANSADVDPRLFYALLLRESGKGGKPWLWTVASKEGGYYFSSKDEAITHINKMVDSGDTLIDIGVAQVNLYWNGHYVDGDIEKLLDPKTNILVGARVLKDCVVRLKEIRKALSCYNTGRVTNVGLKYADDVLKVASSLGYREPKTFNEKVLKVLKAVAVNKERQKPKETNSKWSVVIL